MKTLFDGPSKKRQRVPASVLSDMAAASRVAFRSVLAGQVFLRGTSEWAESLFDLLEEAWQQALHESKEELDDLYGKAADYERDLKRLQRVDIAHPDRWGHPDWDEIRKTLPALAHPQLNIKTVEEAWGVLFG